MKVKDIRTIGHLTRVTARPGDLFVLHYAHPISDELATRMRKVFEKNLKEVGWKPWPKVIVLGDGAKLGVVRKENIKNSKK